MKIQHRPAVKPVSAAAEIASAVYFPILLPHGSDFLTIVGVVNPLLHSSDLVGLQKILTYSLSPFGSQRNISAV